MVLRPWSRSCEGRKPVGLGGCEGERGAAALVVTVLGGAAGKEPCVVQGALGGASKQPKASCHALLNSSVPLEAPGLSRSCRKDRSPRSPSSSSAPKCGARPESKSAPAGARENKSGLKSDLTVCWTPCHEHPLIHRELNAQVLLWLLFLFILDFINYNE